MVPTHFTSVTFMQKKKDITLYRATDGTRRYILKSIITKDAAVRQAFYDEYETLSALRHPSVPVYYWLHENKSLPGQPGGALTLCMEDCSAPALSAPLSAGALSHILIKTADVLLYLLEHGVLYTDLNPSNLIISEQNTDYAQAFTRSQTAAEEDSFVQENEDINYEVSLVDYTYCYYFLRNPYPEYSLRFSYDVSPHLKGQQFLIQALTYLFYDLIEAHHIEALPSTLYQILETGRNPSEELSLSDFSAMLRRCVSQT